MRDRLLLSTLAAFALVAMGCTVTHTSVQRQQRPALRFSSRMAAAAFYEAVLNEQFPDDRGDSIALKFHVGLERRSLPSRSHILAEAARRADSNRDGTISDSEAGYFAQQHERSH